MGYHDDARMQMDDEEKITIYNYEKFLHPEYLKTVDTQSEEFKNEVKLLNLNSETKYERLQRCK